jgi:hypothetical protein
MRTANAWSDMKRCQVSVPQHVVFRDLADETVILNINTGQYHSVDRVGARFFEVMRDVPALELAIGPLAGEFEQPFAVIETDLAAFVGEMVELGVIELQPAA